MEIKVEPQLRYKLSVDNKELLLDWEKINIIKLINLTGSIKEAAKLANIPYSMYLYYIKSIESSLGISLVFTFSGGNKGGYTKLTRDGKLILDECKKIDSIKRYKKMNEIKAKVTCLNKEERIMTINSNSGSSNGIDFIVPLDEAYNVGNEVLTLVSYDDVFIMLKNYKSSLRNVFKGKVVEFGLNGELVNVKVDIGEVYIYSTLTILSMENLGIKIGKEVFIGFKAVSIGILRL